jgi:uncharacterized lipoprotein YehR (DUF1307 family)
MRVSDSLNAALCVPLILLLCAACGGPPEPSGRYSLNFQGDELSLDFKGDGKVVSSMTESGETKSVDCKYSVKDEKIGVTCPTGGPGMKLTFKDGSLETDLGGVTVKFDER